MRHTEKVSLLSKESAPENVIQCHLTCSHVRALVFRIQLLYDGPKVSQVLVFWEERLYLRITQKKLQNTTDLTDRGLACRMQSSLRLLSDFPSYF